MSPKQYTVTDDIIASSGKRLANVVIDYVVRILLSLVLGVILGVIALLTDNPQIMTYLEEISPLHEFFIGVVIMLVYYNVFEILFSVTVGKMITKTIVVNHYGEKPDANTILLRTICRIIPFEVFSFFGTPCVGWHDSLSKTYVVNKADLEEQKALFYSFEEIGNQADEDHA